MNSKILKLDAPYNIIYAGGRVGRHIATMTIWEDDDMGIYGARQYAMIDEGGELAAGALAVEADLSDCRVICNESDPRVQLRWLAKIVEYDMRQEEPVEFQYIWERLSLLGVKVIWDKARDEKGELLKDEDGELIDAVETLADKADQISICRDLTQEIADEFIESVIIYDPEHIEVKFTFDDLLQKAADKVTEIKKERVSA
jgi:hypothetical protein